MKMRMSVPGSLEREELTRGLGKQALPHLPGGGGQGGSRPAAWRRTDCGAPASPLSPSAGGEARGASWNDIGRSANQARGCSWRRHLGGKTHTRPAGLPCQFERGYARAPVASPPAPRHPLSLAMHLLDFKIPLSTWSFFVILETKTAGWTLPGLPGFRPSHRAVRMPSRPRASGRCDCEKPREGQPLAPHTSRLPRRRRGCLSAEAAAVW